MARHRSSSEPGSSSFELRYDGFSYQAEAKRALDQEFIPILKGAPGFVGAYFVAVDDTHGVSIQVFETEEQAKAAAPPETGPGMGGVKLDTVQFGEVIGAA